MSEKKKDTTSDSLSVSIRKSTLDDNGIEILKAVIKSKEGLFRKAFGSEKMDIIVDDEKITFPWFSIMTERFEMFSKRYESLSMIFNKLSNRV